MLVHKAELQDLTRRAEQLATNRDFGEEAASMNKRIIELDPGQVGAYTRLGRCCETAGDFEGAAALYEAALNLAPQNSVARNRLEEIRYNQTPIRIDTSTPTQDNGHAHGYRSSPKYDLPDYKHVAAYFEHIYPNEDDRAVALGCLVDTIRIVDHENIATLGLTIRDSFSRLNVGKVGWGFLGHGRVQVLCAERELIGLTETDRSELTWGPAEYVSLRSLPEHPVCHLNVSPSRLPTLPPRLWQSYASILRGLARQVRRTPYYQSHTPAAIQYIEDFLGEGVPAPLY